MLEWRGRGSSSEPEKHSGELLLPACGSLDSIVGHGSRSGSKVGIVGVSA